eukprot:10233171-Alexandrium_andersonii.AAC.1
MTSQLKSNKPGPNSNKLQPRSAGVKTAGSFQSRVSDLSLDGPGKRYPVAHELSSRLRRAHPAKLHVRS